MVALQSIELMVSDRAEIGALYNRLREVPDIEISRTAGKPGPGELGALDVLTAIGGSSGLVAAIRTIPAYLRARRSEMSVKATVNGTEFIITVQNIKDVIPVIEGLLGD